MVKFEGYDKVKNKGLEGMVWDVKNERLYVVKERKFIMIKEVEMSKNGIIRVLFFVIIVSVSDVFGFEYYVLMDLLLVLLDELKMILEVSFEWWVCD